MSKPLFDVHIASYEQIREISGSWTADDFKKLLTVMDYPPEDASSDSELRELCLMCLQDREPAAAAEIALTYKLHDRLAKGQIQNLAIEMPDEKLWEHYADLSLHKSFFHVGTLMFEAFPDLYHEPDAVKISLEISPKNPVAIELEPGHCTFHHPLMVHGSFDNKTDIPRRAVVLNVIRDGVASYADEELLAGIPVIPKGEKMDGQFFPLLYEA